VRTSCQSQRDKMRVLLLCAGALVKTFRLLQFVGIGVAKPNLY
jgi:hypothetical protein